MKYLAYTDEGVQVLVDAPTPSGEPVDIEPRVAALETSTEAQHAAIQSQDGRIAALESVDKPLEGPQGEAGLPGSPGVEGPAGAPGAPMDTWNGKPTQPGWQDGQTMLDVKTGDVYGWDGTAWNVVGNIKGPKGDPGKDGTTGVYDPTNLITQLNAIEARLAKVETAVASYSGANPQSYGIDLATIGGANDEERKDNGIALAKSSGRPMILPFNRAFTPTTGFQMWGAGGPEGAFRLVGAFPFVGNQNLEQGTKKVLSWIQPGSGVGLDDKALFVNPGTIFDFHLAHFAVQGAQGGGVAGVNGNAGGGKQFYYGPYSAGRNAYRCSFENIAMNFMAAGFGSYNNPAAFTCVTMTGRMEYLNCWPGHGGWLSAGGSDNLIDCHLNAGPSASPVQAGRVVNGLRGDWLVDLSSMSKTRVTGELFLTANNQWGGLRIRGTESNCYDLKLSGAVVEGYKPTGTQPSGPASGTLVRVEGGTGVIRDFGVGQGMAWPAANEKSVFEVAGGQWLVEGTTFYTGTTPKPDHSVFVYTGAVVTENGTGYREK